jgi:hypothetical protein
MREHPRNALPADYDALFSGEKSFLVLGDSGERYQAGDRCVIRRTHPGDLARVDYDYEGKPRAFFRGHVTFVQTGAGIDFGWVVISISRDA